MSKHDRSNGGTISGKGGDQQNDYRRRVQGEIDITGIVEAHFPKKLVDEYEASNRDTSKRDKYRFIVECVTLALVFIVGVFSYIQTRQSIKSADASINQSQTATKALYVSERAYLAVTYGALSSEKGRLDIAISNSGHLPSQNTRVFHSSINMVCKEQITWCPSNGFEVQPGFGRTTPIQPVTNGAPGTVGIALDGFDKKAFVAGEQYFTVSGFVHYNDGFDDTPTRTSNFCFQAAWDNIAGKPAVVGCRDVTPKGPHHKDYN